MWLANGNKPIHDATGMLAVNATDGMLTIIYSGGNIILPTTWSAGYRKINTSATLHDDGNLVLRQVHPSSSTSGRVLWQSFDYPIDISK